MVRSRPQVPLPRGGGRRRDADSSSGRNCQPGDNTGPAGRRGGAAHRLPRRPRRGAAPGRRPRPAGRRRRCRGAAPPRPSPSSSSVTDPSGPRTASRPVRSHPSPAGRPRSPARSPIRGPRSRSSPAWPGSTSTSGKPSTAMRARVPGSAGPAVPGRASAVSGLASATPAAAGPYVSTTRASSGARSRSPVEGSSGAVTTVRTAARASCSWAGRRLVTSVTSTAGRSVRRRRAGQLTGR